MMIAMDTEMLNIFQEETGENWDNSLIQVKFLINHFMFMLYNQLPQYYLHGTEFITQCHAASQYSNIVLFTSFAWLLNTIHFVI